MWPIQVFCLLLFEFHSYIAVSQVLKFCGNIFYLETISLDRSDWIITKWEVLILLRETDGSAMSEFFVSQSRFGVLLSWWSLAEESSRWDNFSLVFGKHVSTKIMILFNGVSISFTNSQYSLNRLSRPLLFFVLLLVMCPSSICHIRFLEEV